MTGTLAVQAAGSVTVVNGMPSQTYANKTGLTAVPCRQQPATYSDALRLGREMGDITDVFFIPPNVGTTAVVVNTTDQVVYGGNTYRVIGGATNPAGDGGMLKIVCSRNT